MVRVGQQIEDFEFEVYHNRVYGHEGEPIRGPNES